MRYDEGGYGSAMDEVVDWKEVILVSVPPPKRVGLSDHLMSGRSWTKRATNKHSENVPQTSTVLGLWYYTRDEQRLKHATDILQVQCNEDGPCMRASGEARKQIKNSGQGRSSRRGPTSVTKLCVNRGQRLAQDVERHPPMAGHGTLCCVSRSPPIPVRPFR